MVRVLDQMLRMGADGAGQVATYKANSLRVTYWVAPQPEVPPLLTLSLTCRLRGGRKKIKKSQAVLDGLEQLKKERDEFYRNNRS